MKRRLEKNKKGKKRCNLSKFLSTYFILLMGIDQPSQWLEFIQTRSACMRVRVYLCHKLYFAIFYGPGRQAIKYILGPYGVDRLFVDVNTVLLHRSEEDMSNDLYKIAHQFASVMLSQKACIKKIKTAF